ncbi:MAG: hypothetical protein ACLGPL_09110 [Acidobacteriota bacterium]
MCEDIKNNLIWMEALKEFVITMTNDELDEIAATPDLEPYLHEKLCNIVTRWRAEPLPA